MTVKLSAYIDYGYVIDAVVQRTVGHDTQYHDYMLLEGYSLKAVVAFTYEDLPIRMRSII